MDVDDRRKRAEEVLRLNPEWYHSIELAPGIVTPGRAPLESWNDTLKMLQLPDVHGKSVLDIGAYDGFFSFAAEKLGATRVVALDDYVWATDMAAYMEDWRKAKRTGESILSPRNSRHWRPDELPGKRPFDAAREILESNVEPVVGNFMTLQPSELGQFDVVLFLGILYHLENPFASIRQVARFLAPGGWLGIETEAMDIPGAPDAAFCEFFPTNELNNDASNWWAPNARGLEGLVTAAGLFDFKLLQGPPKRSPLSTLQARLERKRSRYRAIASARAAA